MPQQKSIEIAKRAAAQAAADLVQSGMIIGLGTGSTAAYFIAYLSERCRKGLKICTVATSQKSLEQALLGGIPIIDINDVTSIDMTIDGADEVDGKKRMIKGAGGALLREKIVASMSKEMVVIVDERKCVNTLGQCSLPIEIIPFAHRTTTHKIEQLGLPGDLRQIPNGRPYLTENHNYIYDIRPHLLPEPKEIEQKLRNIPGVVETGLFLNLAGRVVVGFEDGHVEIR